MCIATAAALPTAAHIRAQAETGESAAVLDTQLISPASYEQYLQLSNPADVSVTKNHTAIADGNILYVYDCADGVYRTYTHTENSVTSQNQIVRLQFADADTLYFLDASTRLYTLEVSAMENAGAAAIATNFVCSEFFIHGETLYFTRATNKVHLLQAPLSDLTAEEDFFEDGISSPNALTVWENELYYTEGGKYLYKFAPDDAHSEPTQLATFSEEIRAMSIIDGVLFCSGKSGFSSYALADLSLQATDNQPLRSVLGNFGRLCVYNDLVYAVSEDGVLAYSATENEFVLEITASSDGPNRFNGATEVCFADDKVFIADANNARISVYDAVSQTFLTAISSPIVPQYLASDGETLLIANATAAALYSLSEPSYGQALPLENATGYNGKLVGAMAVYGNYYLATDNNYFYALSQTDGVWSTSETKKSISVYPKMLTADVYGNLYAVCGNSVYRYTEETFVSPTVQGEEICEILPANTVELRLDYQRNLYALTDGGVTRFTALSNYTQSETTEFTAPFVYGKEVSLLSFDFGVKENAAYLLCAGDYLLCTQKLALPTVNTIPTAGVADSVLTGGAKPAALVTTKADALLIEFSLSELQGAEYFPYLSHQRQKTPVTALKLGEVNGFTLLAVSDGKGGYKTYITETAACTPLDENEYKITYAEENRKTLYLSSEAALYAFPCFAEELALSPLPRRAQITALGEINGGFDYYWVSYTDANGTQQTGYIPKAYANEISGAPTPSVEKTYGETESDNDSVWRMAYLLLGTFAICILVDYLLIRKPKED